MKINLIEIAQEYLSDTVVSKIADSIGIEPNTAKSVVDKVFPLLLGILGHQAQSDEGAQRIFGVVNSADSEILNDLDNQLSGNNSEFIDQGKNTLTNLLGDKATSVTNAIGAIPGVSSGKAGGILGLLTPILTGLLKKQSSAAGLDASGLASLLGEQKSFIGSSLGGDLLDKIGLGSLASFAGKGTGAAADAASGAVDSAGNTAKAIGGLFAGAAGVAGAAVSGTANSIGNAAGDAAEGTLDAANAVGGDIGNGVGATKDGAAELARDVSSAAGGAAKTVGGAASAVGSGAANLAGDAAGAAAATTQKAGNGLLKLLPLLLIGLLVFFGIKACKNDADTSTAPGSNTSTDIASQTSSTTEGAASSENDRGILGGLKEGASKAADTATNTASAASDGVSDAANATGDALGGIKDGAADLGNKAVNSASDVASAAAQGMKDTATAAGDTAGNLADGASDLGTKAVTSAGDAASAAAQGMKDTATAAGDAVGNLADGASDLGNKAIDSTGNAASGISDGTASAAETASKAINGLAIDPTTNGEASPAATPRRSFVPDAKDGAAKIELSEKASNLASSLSQIQVSNDSDLDGLYSTMGANSGSQFLYRIPFATGETGVPNGHQAALIAKLKEANPDATLVTIGYADVRGDDALNKRLSYGRAREVGDWIKGTLGGSTNIESFSMGETDRFSKSDFSKNRVVEVWQIK